MTLVLSISANTAAYAADALKPARRLSAKDQAEEIRITADRGASRAETGNPVLDQLIPATAIGFDLLSPEQQPHQQTSLAQVQAAYRDLSD